LQGKQDRSIKKKSRSEENTLERREEKKKREREGYAAGESQAILAQFLGQ
jgi:ribosome assembly protein YihI (activator of Der GTPase)